MRKIIPLTPATPSHGGGTPYQDFEIEQKKNRIIEHLSTPVMTDTDTDTSYSEMETESIRDTDTDTDSDANSNTTSDDQEEMVELVDYLESLNPNPDHDIVDDSLDEYYVHTLEHLRYPFYKELCRRGLTQLIVIALKHLHNNNIGFIDQDFSYPVIQCFIEHSFIEGLKVLEELYPKFASNETHTEEKSYIHMCAERGDLECMKIIHRNDETAMIDWVDDNYDTPMMVCARRGYLDCMNYIHTIRPRQIHRRNHRTDQSCLHLSAEGGHLECVKFICEHAPKLIVKRSQSQGYIPLHVAVKHLPVVKAILERDPSALTYRARKQDSIIHLCAEMGTPECLRFFIEKCRQPDIASRLPSNFAINKRGDNPLHTCVIAGRVDNLQVLVSEYPAYVDLDGGDGYQPFYIAGFEGQVECLEILFRASPKSVIIERGDQLEIDYLTGRGQSLPCLQFILANDPNRDKIKISDLIAESIYKGYLVTTTWLIAEYPSKFLEPYDNTGALPIHLAIDHHRLEIIRAMVDKIPDILTQGHPLAYASHEFGYEDVLQFLIERNPRGLFTPDDNEVLPIEIAMERDNSPVFNLLLNAMFDHNPEQASRILDKIDFTNSVSKVVRGISGHKMCPFCRGNGRWYPLYNDDIELLKCGVCFQNFSPSHRACAGTCGHTMCFQCLIQVN